MSINIRGFEFYSGQIVLCQFKDLSVVEGALYIEQDFKKIFICHNECKKSGSTSSELFGYNYSWVFSYNEIQNQFTQGILHLIPFSSELRFKKAIFSDSLVGFINFSNYSNILILFQLKIKPFENLDCYDISSKSGFIKISGKVNTPNGVQTKVVEIKLVRFIKRILDSPEIKNILTLTSKQLEVLHNEFVSFQSDTLFDLQFYKGKDIIEGYKSENYSKSSTGGSIHKSCMSDKLGFLSIYTENPEQVQLAYIKSKNGIEARCLIWKIEDTFYFDRIYYSIDWFEKLMGNKLSELGYLDLQAKVEEVDYFKIKLSNHRFDNYPYLDTFRFLNMASGNIFAANSADIIPYKFVRKLTSTSGGYEFIRN